MNGLPWWRWARARRRLDEWVRVLIAERPYTISFEHGQGSYVNFTTREIVIEPEMPATFTEEAARVPTTWNGRPVQRPTQLGVLCARAAAYHEAGHVLYTDPVPGLCGILHHLWNALEDQRMEDATARSFAPAGRDFSELGRRLWLCGAGTSDDRLTTLLNACLFHRWDSRRTPGEPSRLSVPDEDRALWETQVRPLVEEAWLVPDSARVADLAREILRRLCIAPPAPLARFPGLILAHGEAGGGAPRGRRRPDEPAWPVPGPAASTGRPAAAHESAETDRNAQDGGPSESRGDAHRDDGAPGTTPTPGADTDAARNPQREALGHDAAAPRGKALRQDVAGAVLRSAAQPDEPDPDLEDALLASTAADEDPSAGQMWMQPFDQLERQVAGDVRRLVRELRVASPDSDLEATNRRGRFDARAAIRSRGERPLVRQAAVGDTPDALALLLAIDGTGSMGGDPRGLAADGGPSDPAAFHNPRARMTHVRPAVLYLHRACAALRIPLAIALACDGILPSPVDTLPYRTTNPVHWLQRFNTDPASEGPRALIAGLHGRASMEAVSRALRICREEFRSRPEPRKVLLYIHDGEPTDESAEAVRATVLETRRAGIVVVGLYLGDQDGLHRMEQIFDPPWTIGAADLTGLTMQVGRILKRFRERR